MGTRIYLSGYGIVKSDGTVSMRIPPPPAGYVYTGSVNVPIANNGTWSIAIGSQPWGQFLASAPYGPVQAYAAEDIVVTGSGLTPGQAMQFVLIGSIDDEASATPVSPVALVTSVSINNAPTVNVSSIGTVGSISNPVTVGSISNAVTVGSVSQPINLASGTVVAIAAGTNSIGTVNLASGSTVTLASGGNNIGIISLASGSSVAINGGVTVNGSVSIAAGSAAIGTVSLAAGSAVNINSGTVNIGTVTGNVGVVNPANTSLAIQRPESLWASLTFNSSGLTSNVGPPANSVPVSDLMIVQTAGTPCLLKIVGHDSGVVYLPTTYYSANGIPTHVPFSPALDASVDITCTYNGSGAGGAPVIKVVGRVNPATVIPVTRTGAAGPTGIASANAVLSTSGTSSATLTDNQTSAALGGSNGSVVRVWAVTLAGRADASGGGYVWLSIGAGSSGMIAVAPIAAANTAGSNSVSFPGGLPLATGLNPLVVNASVHNDGWATVAYSIDS